MKKITLICFGKLKSPGFDLAVQEFTKRLSRYTQFQVIELKSLPLREKSEILKTQVREKEGSLVLEQLERVIFKNASGKLAKIWCLDEKGSALKTEAWARELEIITEKGGSEMVFVIGGSYGLGETILKLAHRRVSFGPQTLSHELARLVLVEQLYRALSFLDGHPYHHK